jgi:hypothetical protein
VSFTQTTGRFSKANNATELHRDVDYFAGALIQRLERLAELEGRRRERWVQCAILARRIRRQAWEALGRTR